MKNSLIFILLIVIAGPLHGQIFGLGKSADDFDDLSDSVLLIKEMNGGILLHTSGWGLKFRKGKNINAFTKRMWEIEFVETKDSKEIKTINPYYPNSRSFVFGKLNNVFMLRGGIGNHHLLNSKPYWGGVELRYFYHGGLSLGLAKPVYLNIINLVNITPYYFEYEITTEKYNPDIHFEENIYGRAAFTKGLDEIKLYPGLYFKGGLNFEFGIFKRAVKELEVGASLEYFPKAIPMMAYNKDSHFFMGAYFSFSFGKRYN